MKAAKSDESLVIYLLAASSRRRCRAVVFADMSWGRKSSSVREQSFLLCSVPFRFVVPLGLASGHPSLTRQTTFKTRFLISTASLLTGPSMMRLCDDCDISFDTFSRRAVDTWWANALAKCVSEPPVDLAVRNS
jgi:hypothetical protein